MLTCDVCGTNYVRQDDLQPEDECDDCASWREYWLSLTPEQQREEERLMTLYAAESEGI